MIIGKGMVIMYKGYKMKFYYKGKKSEGDKSLCNFIFNDVLEGSVRYRLRQLDIVQDEREELADGLIRYGFYVDDFTDYQRFIHRYNASNESHADNFERALEILNRVKGRD